MFVRTLIDLGRSLGLTTVAEWVQDEGGAEVLAEWGCDYLQGELIGRASLERPWSNRRRRAPRRAEKSGDLLLAALSGRLSSACRRAA